MLRLHLVVLFFLASYHGNEAHKNGGHVANDIDDELEEVTELVEEMLERRESQAAKKYTQPV